MKIVDDQGMKEKKYDYHMEEHLYAIRDAGEFLKLLHGISSTSDIGYEAPISVIDILNSHAGIKLTQIHDALEYLADEVEDFKYKPLILNPRRSRKLTHLRSCELTHIAHRP